MKGFPVINEGFLESYGGVAIYDQKGLIYRSLLDFIHLFYPRLCIGCGKTLKYGETDLCVGCYSHLPLVPHKSMTDGSLVNERFYGRVDVQYSTALLRYEKEGVAQKILHHVKYHGGKELGYRMGKMLGGRLLNTPMASVDAIVPVPLHPNKFRKRGYNQSEWIAMGLSKKLNVPLWNDVLERVIENPTQTRKSAFERWENVKGIFKLVSPEKVAGKHLLIVDDVLTTGSTIEACALPMLTNGQTKVSLATLAVVD